MAKIGFIGMGNMGHALSLIHILVCGFEHSIANMSVMAIGLMSPNGVAGLTVAGYFHNLLWVTLGNIIGGSIFVALPYYLIQKK